jgi:hypothetical protein
VGGDRRRGGGVGRRLLGLERVGSIRGDHRCNGVVLRDVHHREEARRPQGIGVPIAGDQRLVGGLASGQDDLRSHPGGVRRFLGHRSAVSCEVSPGG